jgi:hypothetical protein
MKNFTLLMALCATLFTGLLFAQPTTSAPTPAQAGADVISVFSGAYTNLSGTNFNPGWGQGTGYAEYTIAGTSDVTKKYTTLDYQGIEFGSTINASSMTTLHWDIWTDVATVLKIYVIGTGERFVSKTTVIGWNSFDIPLSDYTSQTSFSVSNLIQFKFEESPQAYHAGTKTVYLDNMYFWKPANVPALTGFTIPAKLVGDAAFTLTAPTSPSAGAFTYTSGNTAVATISGNTVTIVGAGTSIVTANQAADGSYSAGSTTASLVVSYAPPSTSAPTPPVRSASNVISVFSGAYTDVAGTNFNPGWGQGTGYSEYTIAGTTDVTKKYTALDYQGIEFGSTINASSMTTLHWDIWTDVVTVLKIYLIGTGERFVSKTTAVGWNSFDIPLTDYTSQSSFSVSNLIQFKFEESPQAYHAGTKTVYLDNMYFWKPANVPTITGFTVPAKIVGDAAFALTAPTSTSAGAFTYTSGNPAVATISGTTVTIVGVGTSVITASQAADGSYTAGSTTASLVVTYAPPTTVAPTPPTRTASDVLSVYSNAYTNIAPPDYYPYWSQNPAIGFNDITISGDNIKGYNSLSYQGTVLASAIDVSAMQYLHIDLWTPNCSAFDFFLIGSGGTGEQKVSLNPSSSGWKSFDIPLSLYDAVTLNSIAQFKFVATATTTPTGSSSAVYVDNIYFYKGNVLAPPTAAVTPTNLPAKVISMFSNAYTNVAIDTWSPNWDIADVADVQIAGNDTKKYTKLGYAGILFNNPVSNEINANLAEYFHMDIFTPIPITFKVKLVDFGVNGVDGSSALAGDDTEGEVTLSPTGSSWVSLDIPMSDFVAAGLTTRANLAQMFISSPDVLPTVYIDNVYFYSSVVLAVEMTDFKAKAVNNTTVLSWKTATETNNAGFSVERSANGINYTAIGEVKGNGTTTVAHDYTFIDQTPPLGVGGLYYRLRQTDFSGKETLSPVVSVLFGKGGLLVKSTLVSATLDVTVGGETPTPLSIFNLSGQQMYSGKVQGSQSIDVSAFAAGLYIIRTGTGEVSRFVKQ